MEVQSTYRYAKISPFKAREVTRAIQGLPVSAALDIVAFSPKKAAAMISKTLKSAVANAENNANLKVDGLVVKEAIVGEGPTMKRMMARARGSGSRILKRSSHIRIVLTDEIQIQNRETRKARTEEGEEETQRKRTGEKAAEAKSAREDKAKKEDGERNNLWDRKLIQLDFASGESRLAFALVRIAAGDARVFAQRSRDSRLREEEAAVRGGFQDHHRARLEQHSRDDSHGAARESSSVAKAPRSKR